MLDLDRPAAKPDQAPEIAGGVTDHDTADRTAPGTIALVLIANRALDCLNIDWGIPYYQALRHGCEIAQRKTCVLTLQDSAAYNHDPVPCDG